MTVLGYSRLIEFITGTDEYKFENHMIILSRHSLSPLRLRSLKQLAKEKRSTVSKILKILSEHSSGGTYKSITSFFNALEKENILSKDKVGNRTYWEFNPECNKFREYLSNIFLKSIPSNSQ